MHLEGIYLIYLLLYDDVNNIHCNSKLGGQSIISDAVDGSDIKFPTSNKLGGDETKLISSNKRQLLLEAVLSRLTKEEKEICEACPVSSKNLKFMQPNFDVNNIKQNENIINENFSNTKLSNEQIENIKLSDDQFSTKNLQENDDNIRVSNKVKPDNKIPENNTKISDLEEIKKSESNVELNKVILQITKFNFLFTIIFTSVN